MVVERHRLRRAARRLQPDPADPGDPGRGRRHHGAQHRRPVEAGAARSLAHAARACRHQLPPVLDDASRARGNALRGCFVAVGLGTAAFSMQDILLEPYGGQILQAHRRRDDVAHRGAGRRRPVGFALAARAAQQRRRSVSARGARRARRASPRSRPSSSPPRWNRPWLFGAGVTLIGFGGGLFALGTLTAAMAIAQDGESGMALGAWGAVQATRPASPSPRRHPARHRLRPRPSRGALGAALAEPVDRLQRRLPHRDRAAVRHPGRDRPARAQRARTAPDQRSSSAWPNFQG